MYEKIDKNGLIDIWPQIEFMPSKFNLTLTPKERCHPIIDNLLLYLKLFPSGRTAFKTSKNALFKISGNSKEDPSLMIDKSVDSPYIIAILSEATQNIKFYIDVADQSAIEHRLISVSFTEV